MDTTIISSDEANLRRLDRELAEATYKNNAQWFEEYLTDDYILTTSRANVMTKSDVVKDIGDLSVTMEPYEPTEVTVKIYGDAAVIQGRIHQRYTTGTERVDADLRYTDVWIKAGGGWVTVVGHASPISVTREKA